MAITVDTETYLEDVSAVPNPVTFSHSVTVGTDFLVVIVAQRGGDLAAVTVTYGGDAMTKAVTAIQGTAGPGIWYRADPRTGPNTVSIGMGTGSACFAGLAVSLDGVKKSDPIDATAKVENEDDPSFDITSIADNCWLMDAMIARGNPVTSVQGTETGRTDWTTDFEFEPGGNEAACLSTKYEDVSPADTKTFSYTNTGELTGHVAACAVSIEPVAAGPTVPDQTLAPTQSQMNSGGMVGNVIMKRRDRIYVPERLAA